jgi:hypothetical protein
MDAMCFRYGDDTWQMQWFPPTLSRPTSFLPLAYWLSSHSQGSFVMQRFSGMTPRVVKTVKDKGNRRGMRSQKTTFRFRPALEQLEERSVLSGGQFLTWGVDNITAPYTLNENVTGPYTLNLYASPDVAPTVSGWTINWGDGSPAEPITGNPSTVTHEFPISPLASFNITAQAHTTAGTFDANTGPGSVLLEPFVSDPWFALRYPTYMALDGAGNLYVTNRDSNDVVRFDPAGNYLGVFIPSGDHGLNQPRGMTFNAAGELFIGSSNTDEVLRYNSAGVFQGKFVPAGSGLDSPSALAFGPDGALYVSSSTTNQVLRYDGVTGAPLGAFVAAGSAGLSFPLDMIFGPDGHLYVSSASTDQVLRYDGATGAPIGSGVFVPAGSGGLDSPRGLAFGPDGNLFVVNRPNESVLRYDGTTGAFLDIYVAPGAGVLDDPSDLLFDAAGDLLVASNSSEAIVRVSGPLAPAPPEPVPTVAAYLPFPARLATDGWIEADGGAKDTRTGIVWSSNLTNEKGSASYNWAPGAADAMIDAGYKDWRIPTLQELQTAAANGAGSHLDLQGYGGSPHLSSTDAGKIKGFEYAWAVNLTTGVASRVTKTSGIHWVVVRDTSANIGSLSDSPDPITQGSTMTLTANGVNSLAAQVAFYRDTNNNNELDVGTDLHLGTDATGDDGWKLLVPIASNLPTGTYRYFAQAADANDVWGNVVWTTNTVQKARGKTSASSFTSSDGGLVLLYGSLRDAATALDDEPVLSSNADLTVTPWGADPRAKAHVLANDQRLTGDGVTTPHQSTQTKSLDTLFEGDLAWVFGI